MLVAMSGGVDSAVAAALLQEQGHDVIGVFMRLGTEPSGVRYADQTSEQSPPAPRSAPPRSAQRTLRGATVSLPVQPDAGEAGRHRGCCSAADAADARAVAARLDIPFYALNFEQDFARLIDAFADEYSAARTPNPCILCNQWLKFGRLLEYADVVGADRIATGHYARVATDNGRPRLLRARDAAKDQSYVLFGVSGKTLARVLFPLGELTKDAVRQHARRLGLPVHDKPESQDICFVPDRDYARVVRARRPDAFRPGAIRHVDGRVLGEHDGLPNFTIGQRRGVNVAVGSPVYVTDLDAATDTLVVGPRSALLSRTAKASRVSWLIETPVESFRAVVRIRYHHAGAEGVVSPLSGGRVRVVFDEPVSAVTPGQALVLYRGEQVVGGGWIDGP